MKIGSVNLPSPFAIAPMAGHDRHGVSPSGEAPWRLRPCRHRDGQRGGARARNRPHARYAEYTEEERPISIQIFGGDPDKMAAAAQIVEGMGADIVDVNMGCPVPKIAKHNAGCSLMREPEHAAAVIAAMAKAVKIPVTVKMRAGWNDDEQQRADAGEDGPRTPARQPSRSTAARRRRATADRPTGISSRASPTT